MTTASHKQTHEVTTVHVVGVEPSVAHAVCGAMWWRNLDTVKTTRPCNGPARTISATMTNTTAIEKLLDPAGSSWVRPDPVVNGPNLVGSTVASSEVAMVGGDGDEEAGGARQRWGRHGMMATEGVG